MRRRRRNRRRLPGAHETAAGRPMDSASRAPRAPAGPVVSALAALVAIVLAALRAALRFSEREVTPARGLAVVALAATIGLGASQFSDYRAVEIGATSYRAVENLAPAPEVDRQSPRSAHGVTVFAIAVAALFVTVFAIVRNWRLARLLAVLGMAAILISLLVDVPQGLREGSAAIDYQGAKAILLGGFWVQLWSAVTLVIVGPLLAAQLRNERAARHPGRARGLDAPGVARALRASPRGSGVDREGADAAADAVRTAVREGAAT